MIGFALTALTVLGYTAGGTLAALPCGYGYGYGYGYCPPTTATLTVIKHVVKDNGGTAVASDFTLDSGGTNDSPDNFPGQESPGTDVTLDPGSYNVTEISGPLGYDTTFSAGCSGSIAAGQTKTCTVTNDDQPAHLIVIKHMVNDSGGMAAASQFILDSGGTNDSPDNFPGQESPGTDVTLDPGSYNVTEISGPPGYVTTFSADCTGTIAADQTKTCTVTNNDIPHCNGVPATIYVNDQGRIVGGPNNGQLYRGKLNGTTGNDVMVGTPGRDEFAARAGNDRICGRDGNDEIEGGPGNDTLFGEGGNDELKGGGGNDTMTGGPGADKFLGGAGTDTATDFTPAQGDTKTGVEIVL